MEFLKREGPRIKLHNPQLTPCNNVIISDRITSFEAIESQSWRLRITRKGSHSHPYQEPLTFANNSPTTNPNLNPQNGTWKAYIGLPRFNPFPSFVCKFSIASLFEQFLPADRLSYLGCSSTVLKQCTSHSGYIRLSQSKLRSRHRTLPRHNYSSGLSAFHHLG